MPAYTGQQLVNAALVNLGVLEQGGVPSTSDAAEALLRLNFMIEQLNIQNKYIWSIQRASYLLTALQGAYGIGPGAAAPFTVPRPDYIESALISLQGPNAANAVTHPLRLIGSQEFEQIHDFSAVSNIPDRLYNDRASPTSLLTFYPKPRGGVSTSVVLFTWAQLTSYASLATSNDLPDGYAEAITNMLAMRCLSMFGVIVSAEVATACAGLAQRAEANLVALNEKARGMMLQPPQQAAA